MGQHQTVVLLTDGGVHAVEFDGRGARVVKRHSIEFDVPRSLYVDHDPELLADNTAKCLTEVAPRNSSIKLVVPLSWCFFQVLESAQHKSGQALSFAFEHFLPVPLEELTCTFVPLDPRKTLAIAVPTIQTQRLLAAIGLRGVEVSQLIVDAVCLICEKPKPTTASKGAVLLDHHTVRFGGMAIPDEQSGIGFVDVIPSPDGDPTLPERLAQRGISRLGDWRVLELGSSSDSAFVDAELTERLEAETNGKDAVALLARSACLAPPCCDLRVGTLAAAGRWDLVLRLAGQCAWLMAACLVIAVVGIHGQKRAHDRQLQDVLAAQSRIYGEVFANQAPPPGAAMRLASERIRLEALTRKQATPTESNSPPLDILREFVAQLPGEVRITLQEARIDEKQVTLRGITTEHRDAERIAEALHRLPDWVTRPPRTRRLDSGGVEFSMAATSATSIQQR